MKHIRGLWSLLMVVSMTLSTAHVSPLKVTYAQDDLIRMLREMRQTQRLEYAKLDGLPMRLPPTHELVSRDDEVNQPQMLEGALSVAENSLMVYQSFRDGNWEIYIADGNNANQRRLTNDAAADIRPKLTMNGTKIAFASNRTGNYEIFTMNTDGSDVRKITNNAATDSAPVWSPDRTQIAFVSTRDGGADIFVMNADGTGERKLTTNPGDELYPSWSPDGKKIIFVNMAESEKGSIRIVLIDSSEQFILFPSLSYPEFPSWSPKSDYIVFDFDSDGDSLQELATIRYWNNIDQVDSGGLIVWLDLGNARSGADLVESWAGSWSPDGLALTYTRVEYGIYDGVIYLANTFLAGYSMDTRSTWRMPYVTGRDLNIDWKWVDTQSPTLIMNFEMDENTTPEISLLRWSIYDRGASGISNLFEAQYREDDTDWQLAKNFDLYPRLRAGDYALPSGNYAEGRSEVDYSGDKLPKTIYLRARVKDFSGNFSDWVETKTRLRGYPLEGQSMDIRFTPIPNVNISTTLPLIESAKTDGRSQFRAETAFHVHLPTDVPQFQRGKYPIEGVKPGYQSALKADCIFVTRYKVVPENNFGIGKNYCDVVLFPLDFIQISANREPYGPNSYTVTVLTELHEPTLFIQFSGYRPPFPTTKFLTISIESKLGSKNFQMVPNYLTGTSYPPYSSIWINMKYWTGQDVTVTINDDKYFDQNSSRSYIESVMLGSWLTPIISDITPSTVPAKSISITLTISGENFIFDKILPTVYVGDKQLYSVELLNENTLTASLPDNFPAGIYDVRVVNPGGQDAVLPNALRVGNAQYLPIVRKR